MANTDAGMPTAERGKGERGGLVPILKGFDSLKNEFAEFKKRMDVIEKQVMQTNGKVQGVLAGAIVECTECEGILQAEKFPKHWLRMHAKPKIEEKEIPIKHERFVEMLEELTKDRKFKPEEANLVKRIHEHMVKKEWLK